MKLQTLLFGHTGEHCFANFFFFSFKQFCLLDFKLNSIIASVRKNLQYSKQL